MVENRISAFFHPAQHKLHRCEETGCWAEGLSPSFHSDSNREQQEIQPYIIFFLSETVVTTFVEEVERKQGTRFLISSNSLI